MKKIHVSFFTMLTIATFVCSGICADRPTQKEKEHLPVTTITSSSSSSPDVTKAPTLDIIFPGNNVILDLQNHSHVRMILEGYASQLDHVSAQDKKVFLDKLFFPYFRTIDHDPISYKQYILALELIDYIFNNSIEAIPQTLKKFSTENPDVAFIVLPLIMDTLNDHFKYLIQTIRSFEYNDTTTQETKNNALLALAQSQQVLGKDTFIDIVQKIETLLTKGQHLPQTTNHTSK